MYLLLVKLYLLKTNIAWRILIFGFIIDNNNVSIYAPRNLTGQ